MSDIIDNIGHALVQTKDYIEEHPWQAAAAVLAGPLVGPAIFAGAALSDAAVKKGLLPAITLGEAAAIGAVAGGAAAAGVAGGVAGEAGLIGVAVLAGAAAAAAKGAEKAAKPADATTQPAQEDVKPAGPKPETSEATTRPSDDKNKPGAEAPAEPAERAPEKDWAPRGGAPFSEAEKQAATAIEKAILSGDLPALERLIQGYHGHAQDLDRIFVKVQRDLDSRDIIAVFNSNLTQPDLAVDPHDGCIQLSAGIGGRILEISTDKKLGPKTGGPVTQHTDGTGTEYTQDLKGPPGEAGDLLKAIGSSKIK